MLEKAQLPLVIFTLLSQMAVGGTLSLLLLDRDNQHRNLVKKGSIFVLGLTLVGMLASLLHLGHPFLAFRALTHVSTSWLSREVIIFGLFTLLILLYAYLNQKEAAGRKPVGIIAAVVGIVGVGASGMLYLLPSHPGWNHYTTLMFFYATVLLLGPIAVQAYLQHVAKEDISVLKSITVKALFIGALVLALANVLNLQYQLNGTLDAVATANLKLGSYLALFVLQIVFSLGGAIACAILLSKGIGAGFAKGEVAAAAQTFNNIALKFAVIILAGEVCGRLLFYLSSVGMAVGNGLGVFN